MRSPTFFQAPRRKFNQPVSGATDFLRSNATMASLLPTVARLASLQKDCAQALPAMFSQCDILQFEGGHLVLATPNAAVAAKLKQQLPKLQAELEKRGWQIFAIKLKVQVIKSIAPVVYTRALVLPEKAMSALDELSNTLPASKQNQDLIAALRALVQRHRDPSD
ncbi:DciA family protein [Janthinobacterium agaricidamnosum]|nr:DciA family protein [Janthinobacterium agaricidamnosum]